MTDQERFQAGNPSQAQGGLNPEESYAEVDQATSQRLGREAQAARQQGQAAGQQGQAGARDYGVASTDEAAAITAGLTDEGAAARRAREGQASRERGGQGV